MMMDSGRGDTTMGSGGTARAGVSMPWKRRLHRFAHSRTTKLLTGLFLLVTALAELTEGLLLDLHEMLDPSHALVVLGGVLVIQSLADILEAAEFFDEAEEVGELPPTGPDPPSAVS